MEINKNELKSMIFEVLHSDDLLIEQIEDDTELYMIGFTSLKFIEFIVCLEQKHNIEILDSDLNFNNFSTVNNILKTLKKYHFNTTKTLKCIVVDCDGVLWHGISGETKLDEPCYDLSTELLAKSLKTMKDNGVYLCICSRNSHYNICHQIRYNKYLSLEDFAIEKTDVTNKANAIYEITNELNISTDSIAFIDDSTYEIEIVSALLPDVFTIRADYSNDIFLNLINKLTSTVPLKSYDRTQMYKEQKEREKFRLAANNTEELNILLHTKVEYGLAQESESYRISELSQRTNRFNMSGKRYSVEEASDFIADCGYSVYTLNASDLYGDMGLVAAAIVKDGVIENFMLSCRVFGRGFEDLLIEKIKKDCPSVVGLYIETEQNKPHSAFYKEHGIKTI